MNFRKTKFFIPDIVSTIQTTSDISDNLQKMNYKNFGVKQQYMPEMPEYLWYGEIFFRFFSSSFLSFWWGCIKLRWWSQALLSSVLVDPVGTVRSGNVKNVFTLDIEKRLWMEVDKEQWYFTDKSAIRPWNDEAEKEQKEQKDEKKRLV